MKKETIIARPFIDLCPSRQNKRHKVKVISRERTKDKGVYKTKSRCEFCGGVCEGIEDYNVTRGIF